jgi:response regulator RpfG family c-di-GMP phosphodiesterase
MACTGVSGQDQRDRGLYECGIDVWSTKPISPKLLKTWVAEWKAEEKALELKRKREKAERECADDGSGETGVVVGSRAPEAATAEALGGASAA